MSRLALWTKCCSLTKYEPTTEGVLIAGFVPLGTQEVRIISAGKN
jgi:hypothetical protein